MAEKNLIKIYVDASSAKRVDIIIKHYTDFMGIVDGYTEGLRYMIECEKESNRYREMGELGVRVQTGGTTSDPTAKKAIRNVMTREALINCDFSGDVMEGVDRAEEQGITYESAQQKIHRIRLRVKNQVIGFMDGKMGGIA